MSYTVHRPSILHRPTRGPSRANEESLEAQYEREQAALKAKQERHTETHQRLLRSLNPQPEDKAAAWEALVASNAVLACRTQRGVHQEDASDDGSRGNGLPEGAKPWHHSMVTQQYSPADEDAARRRFAAEVAAENQRLAQEREMRRIMEESARRQPVQDAWYNRGDTHRQFQPLFTSSGGSAASVPLPVYTATQQPSSASPWAPTVPKAIVGAVSHQWQPKTTDRQYPWTWQ